MRKIRSNEDIRKSENMKKIIVGVVLVGLMVLSTVGYAFNQTGRDVKKALEYNGFKFTLEEDGLWHGSLNEYESATVYNPEDTENISSYSKSSINNYQGKTVYFSHDSDVRGIQEISRNIGGLIERIQFACLDDCEENLPIKNCTDNVIIIRESKETLINQEENCIYILSEADETIRACDAFIFKLFGVN
ncbi:MAG: hypothetical protein ABIG37_01985 [Nanoarchaeota archaeon]|nr:hypothetical protein [Nanoarchaeota archaeon]